MNLELRNIKYAAFASEETNCYEAMLYLDGRKVAQVSNEGHGGPDHVYWLDCAAEAKIEAYFKGLPKIVSRYMIDGKPMELDPCLEMWCGEKVSEWLTQRDLKRLLARKVVGLVDGKLYTFNAKGSEHAKWAPAIEKKHPGVVILNALPVDEALVLYRKHG